MNLVGKKNFVSVGFLFPLVYWLVLISFSLIFPLYIPVLKTFWITRIQVQIIRSNTTYKHCFPQSLKLLALLSCEETKPKIIKNNNKGERQFLVLFKNLWNIHISGKGYYLSLYSVKWTTEPKWAQQFTILINFQ